MPPTAFQRRMLWAAITALSLVAIAGVVVLTGWLVISAISFLQAVITPIAIAAIIAYLVEPVVRWLEKWRISRTLAVILVFLGFITMGGAIVIGVVPSILSQADSFRVNFPQYTKKAETLVHQTFANAQKWAELPLISRVMPGEHPATPEATPAPDSATPGAPAGSPSPSPTSGEKAPNDLLASTMSNIVGESLGWLKEGIPKLGNSTWLLVQRGLGFFGFLLSLILVPIFLFFFLQEGPAIAANWSKYLPLRASPLKSELVSLISEINSYLINFFRGQLMVSLIDGALIAFSLLVFIGLDFSLLIGLMVGILGLIPYAGMMITWIPAVLIAAAQFGDWSHPFWVTVIFIAANNIDGMIIAPKIVGESVGLHPLTVIISVLTWSLILGGILGALLAVPLTATLKVLLKRYFWDRPADTKAHAR